MRPHARHRRVLPMRRRITRGVALPLVGFLLTATMVTGWAYWGVDSLPGGSGAAAAASVSRDSAPSASATDRSVLVTWSAGVPRSGAPAVSHLVHDNVGNSKGATDGSITYAPSGAHWRFDAGSGTSALDSSGNGHTSTLQAGAGWTAGRWGTRALSLNGTAPSWASSPSPVVDTSESYSVAAWVKLDSLTGYQTVVSIEGSTVGSFYLQKAGNGRFAFSLPASDTTNGGDAWTYASGVVAATDVWYHLVGVYDKKAGSVQLYVNGVSQARTTGAVGWSATGATTIGRAKHNGAQVDFLDGDIDDVRFFDRPLTAAEVGLLAGADSTGPAGGSVEAADPMPAGVRH